MPTDVVAFHNAHFGAGVGPILFNSFGCSGSEDNLIDCSHSSIVSCYGGHSNDVGVRCQGLLYTCLSLARCHGNLFSCS